MKHLSSSKRLSAASALVITLLFIVMIAVLTVGFLTTMKTEVMTSRSHLNGKRAELLAMAGAEMAQARLREAVSSTNRAWAAQPGRITRTGEDFALPFEEIDLSSGPTASVADEDAATNLNTPRYDNPALNLVASTNAPMRVSWIYVREDGSLSSGNAPGYSQANPVVGRFAFWVDDESAKINLNTAGKRDATRPLADPSQVNLAAVFPTSSEAPDDIMTKRSGSGPFRTLDEARVVSSEVAEQIEANSFSLTALSSSPEENLFNEPRIVLTTQKNAADDADFLDILTVENTDPGRLANLSPSKVSTQVNRIASLLRRADWPYRPGKNLADKFTPVRVEQIALNILEYVRARESSEPLIEPIRGDLTGPGNAFVWQAAPNGPTAMIGNVRGLRATEMGIWVADAPTTVGAETKLDAKFKLEVHLPRQGGLDSVDLTTLSLMPLVGIGKTAAPQDMGNKPITVDEISGGGPVIQAGEYRLITRALRLNTTARPNVSGLSVRFALSKTGSSARLEVVTQKHIDATSWLTYDIDPAGTAEDAIRSFAVDDPMTNKIKENWILSSNSFAAANPSSLGTSSSANPQQDTNAADLITDAGVRMPAPKGTTSSTTGQMLNPNGLMGSTGELGHVHTGVECAAAAGVPWRTLRLQPQKSANDLPDWIVLDLFCVPKKREATDLLSFYERPERNQAGGQININAEIPTFDDGVGGPLISRDLPLTAMVKGADSITDSSLETLVENIVSHVPATGTNPGQTYGVSEIYLSRGELCEIDGVASSGESSESVISELVDHATTRSSVFSVFAIGQSVQQLPSGRIVVLGERRLRNIVKIGKPNSKVSNLETRNLDF